MLSALNRGTTARRVWTGLGLVCLLLGLLACAGGGSNAIPPLSNTPPNAPTLSVPVTGTVGFPVAWWRRPWPPRGRTSAWAS
jgi:hypothetical protein